MVVDSEWWWGVDGGDNAIKAEVSLRHRQDTLKCAVQMKSKCEIAIF